MATVAERLAFIRAGMETKRYHVVPTLRVNTVAHHSCGVALIVSIIFEKDVHWAEDDTLLMAALTHDLAEHKVGDLPADAKRALHSDVKEALEINENEELRVAGYGYMLDAYQIRILKFADCADGALFCCRERAMGNKLITPTYYNYLSYLHQLNPRLGPEAEVMAFIVSEWEKACG